MQRIALICCYLGKLPNYFNLFLESCRTNPTIDIIIIGDKLPYKNSLPNVRFYKSTLDDLNKRFTEKLGFDVNLPKAYKLCDYKPGYGLLFNDLLKDYNFWGYIDIDLIFGNIRHFFPESLLEKNDILTVRGDKWLSGALTLLRNTSEINSIFLQNPNIKEVLLVPENKNFCECGHNWDQQPNKKVNSMYDLVIANAKKGLLNVNFRNIVSEPRTASWDKFKIYMQNGHLYDYHKQEEILFFHLVFAKSDYWFKIPEELKSYNEYEITNIGIKELAPTSLIDETRLWIHETARIVWLSLYTAKRTLRNLIKR
jgi:hypothetical protein